MENNIKRYAGLRQVQIPGFSVAQAVERQRSFAYVEQRLMRLLASRVVTIANRDIKALLARLQYEDATHADGWRQRIGEMRTNKKKLETVPNAALALLFDEAEYLPGTYPFLAAIVEVFKPALLESYRVYLSATNDLADYPSVRLLRQVQSEEEEHLQALRSVLQNLTPSAEEQQQSSEWQAHLRAYLNAAGGIDGSTLRQPLPERRFSQEPYRIPHALVRDNAVPRVWDYQAPLRENTQDYLNYMMGLRLSEINVSEGLAIVLFETPNMAWSFYLDISRHCWDEMRHSLFGEAAIEATYGRRDVLPMRDYEGVFVMEVSPLEQYTVLGLEVEGKNMKYPPGKRDEWEFARDEARHPLMTTFQDFDWADEVLHVNIARRQLDTWFEGGLKAITGFSKTGREHRTKMKQRHQASSLPQPSTSHPA